MDLGIFTEGGLFMGSRHDFEARWESWVQVTPRFRLHTVYIFGSYDAPINVNEGGIHVH